MIKTLLLTGENNHDWARSSPFCRDILEKSGTFSVEVSDDPNAALADAEALLPYDLLFTDYNGPLWNETARAHFLGAVRDGTGLTILHAANNAFDGWTEYEKMLGLAWREGTGHGKFHEFEVDITDRDHPITQDVENFRTWDELYHRLVPMHGVDCRVLASAFSDPESGGTGNHEPLLMVLNYGKGRIFHDALGHVWSGDPEKNKGCSMIAFEGAGFQRTLLRGSEWAARGECTL
jgi:type 1 glutamine amidotransferase